MKRGRLPLTALRSFEAAGRHLSFSRAAEELFVSQAAVSRQIRELETLIGRPLFERLHRRVALTDAGQELLAQLTRSFDAIDVKLTQLQAEQPQAILRISVEPAFAGALLIPKLHRFQRLHPQIDVQVDADTRLVEFRRHEAEIAIRHSVSATSWPRTDARHLLDVALTPVMTPGLLASGPLGSPKDLARHTLLHETDRNGWEHWFRAAGFPELALQRGPIFPDATLVMQACRLGHGIGLGDRRMEAEDLRANVLVRPFDIDAPFGAYWLVTPNFRKLSKPAAVFAAWIIAEFSTEDAAEGP
jgi:LysR family glycine cleavage system transcriptional activator